MSQDSPDQNKYNMSDADDEMIPIPCTSKKPCNQDETSQPVVTSDSSFVYHRDHTSAITTKLDSILSKNTQDVAKLKADIANVKEDLVQAQENIDQRFSQMEEKYKLEIQTLKTLIKEMKLETHESRIAEIENYLELNKEMAERKETRFNRAINKTSLPDGSPYRMGQLRDRKDSGLSMTSIDEAEEYDQGYESTTCSRNSSFTELKTAVTSSSGNILGVVPESS